MPTCPSFVGDNCSPPGRQALFDEISPSGGNGNEFRRHEAAAAEAAVLTGEGAEAGAREGRNAAGRVTDWMQSIGVSEGSDLLCPLPPLA